MPIAWTQGTDDPSYPVRQWVAAGQWGTKMFLFGGYEAPSATRIYDMATDQWSSGASFSYSSNQPANTAPTVGNKIYVHGSGRMHVYDVIGNSWTYYNGGHVSSYFSACHAVGTDIYVAGGWSSQVGFSKFNTLTNTWSSLPNLPAAANKCYAAAFANIDSDNIRLFGSLYGTGNPSMDWSLTYNYNYRVSTGTWDTTTPAQIPFEPDCPYMSGSGPKNVGTCGAGVIRIGNNIHVIGGAYTTAIGSLHNRIYNITSNTWSDGLAKPSGMNMGGMGFYENKLYTYMYGMEIYEFIDAPVTPINPAAEGRNQRNIITWQDPDWATGITYNLYWSFVPGVTTSDNLISGLTNSFTYNHTGLTNGVPIYYKIASYNAGYDIESSLSVEFSGTPSGPNTDGRIIW